MQKDYNRNPSEVESLENIFFGNEFPITLQQIEWLRKPENKSVIGKGLGIVRFTLGKCRAAVTLSTARDVLESKRIDNDLEVDPDALMIAEAIETGNLQRLEMLAECEMRKAGKHINPQRQKMNDALRARNYPGIQ